MQMVGGGQFTSWLSPDRDWSLQNVSLCVLSYIILLNMDQEVENLKEGRDNETFKPLPRTV